MRPVFIIIYSPLFNHTFCVLNTHKPVRLGLIEKHERDNLKILADIRNTFAHRYDIHSFEHDKSKKLLSKLNYGKDLNAIVEKLISNTPNKDKQKHLLDIFLSDRNKFKETVRNLFISLLQKLDSLTYKEKMPLA